MKVLNCNQMRALEQSAVDGGIGYSQLMENAGTGAVRFMRKNFSLADKRIVILCGKGNNGGDGFVMARHLCDLGAAVTVVLAEGFPVTDLAKNMLAEIRSMKIKVIRFQDEPVLSKSAVLSADYIVDAVYGIGFHGSVRDELIPLFHAINDARATVISVDAPSGVQCDTGAVEGVCIRADYTVTFTALKVGQLLQPAKSYCGQITVVPVGISAHLISSQNSNIEVTELETVKHLFQPRNPESNKGDYGKLLCLCGSEGMAGAAVMAAKAAARCGAGLVDVVLPKSIYPIVSSQIAEPIYTLLDYDASGLILPDSKTALIHALQSSSACLIGCGLGMSPGIADLVYEMITKSEVPLILDADGINAVAANIDILKTAKVPVILTPHPGEMSRLLHTTAADVQKHRLEYAGNFAKQYGVVLVLKGSGTIIAAPDGRLYVNPTGNAGMAKGGSGDVLAGMIASFAAQSVEPLFAAVCGVYLHGLAGDRCADKLSQRAMLPTDMIQELPRLFLEFEQ